MSKSDKGFVELHRDAKRREPSHRPTPSKKTGPNRNQPKNFVIECRWTNRAQVCPWKKCRAYREFSTAAKNLKLYRAKFSVVEFRLRVKV